MVIVEVFCWCVDSFYGPDSYFVDEHPNQSLSGGKTYRDTLDERMKTSGEFVFLKWRLI